MAYATGEVWAGMTRAVRACLVVMGIGMLGGIQIAYGAPGLWLALLLNAWFFSSLAVALAMHVKAHADQALLSSFVITPMAFLGGTFFPLDRLPGWAQHVLELLPLPHAAQAMQAAAIGQPVRFLSYGLLFLGAGASFAWAILSARSAQGCTCQEGAVSASCWACRFWPMEDFSSIVRRWHAFPTSTPLPPFCASP